VPEPTATLAFRAARDDPEALDELVVRLRPLRSALARRFAGVAPRDDLEQSGVLGVMAALERYDHTRGVPFESYAAPFVIGEMAACARAAAAMAIPPGPRGDVRALEDAIDALSRDTGHTPIAAELADRLGWSDERVVDALRARAASRPLPVADLPDHALAVDDNALEAAEARLELGPRLRLLEPRLRAVLALRFGAELSQAAIGERMGISQMHVSRLLRDAIEQLRASD
jgi:RNA polymerase sigma-B factor